MFLIFVQRCGRRSKDAALLRYHPCSALLILSLSFQESYVEYVERSFALAELRGGVIKRICS